MKITMTVALLGAALAPACSLPAAEPVPVERAATVTSRWDGAYVTSTRQEDGRWLTRLFTDDAVPRAEVAWAETDAYVTMHVITPERRSRQAAPFASPVDANAGLYSTWSAVPAGDVAYAYQCARGLTRDANGCDWSWCMEQAACVGAWAGCAELGQFHNLSAFVDADGVCACETECVQGYTVPEYDMQTCEDRCGCSGCCDDNECCI